MKRNSHIYKNTEVGTIPVDWKIVSLSEIGSFSKGTGVSREESNTGKIPCIRYGEIYTTHNDYIKSYTSHISPSVALQAKQLRQGDILFAASGETKEDIGKAVAFLDSFEAYAGGDIIIFSPTKECDSKFLGYLLNSPIAVKQKSSMGQGDAVVHIHVPELAKVQIPLPPIQEQKAIAQYISGTDCFIFSLESEISKKRQIKNGVMQNLLTGKVRLPEFNGKWIKLELGEIGKITGAGVDKTINDDERPVRLLNFLDVYHRDKIYPNELTMWVTASESKCIKCDIKQGDIFLTPSSEMPDDIGRSAVSMADIKDACYSYHIIRLRPSINLDLNYSAYMLKTNQFEEQIKVLSEGSGKRYVISLKNFREISVTIPEDIKEQEAIGHILTTMDDEIAALEAERDKYISIKQGMMQKLLTGEIRLPICQTTE